MESSLDRDERLISILAKARDVPSDQRQDFLRSACADDNDLYRELVQTLEEEKRMGQFLLDPILDSTTLVRPFEVGQIVEDRFEILRFIGEGGMGVVYEVFDRKRNIKIAIKAAKPGFQRLLSPELEGALTVRHHNVCLVNEIHTTETKHGPIDFLTMELLDGETLNARLKEKHRLPSEEALDIALQVCAGVAEAHRSGIIHRDLKTSNILLCRDNDGSCRAVITDFGLAGAMNAPSTDFGGTPGYMAPELNLGARGSKASDIYALGVVFYEIVVGKKPFDPAASDEAFSHRPDAPTAVVEGLDPRWDEAILPCLEPLPEARPSDASQIASVLKARRIPKGPLVASALTLLVLIVVAMIVPPSREWLKERFWPIHSKQVSTVVLSDFTGDNRFDDALKIALGIQLEQSPSLHVLSDEKVDAILKLMDRAPNQPIPPEVARQVCLRTNGYAYLAGTVNPVGEHFLIAVKAVNCQTGETLASAEAEAKTQENLLRTITIVGNKLRAHLGESLPSQEKFNKPLEEATTSSLEALQAFSRARRVQMTGEADPIPFFQRAVELDPKFATAYLALGTAYDNIGQMTLAMENYQKAYELRDRVSERERFVIEGHYYDAITGELEKANQSYRAWIQAYPQDWQPHQNLSVNYTMMGQYESATKEAQEAIRLSSDNVLSFVVLASNYNALNQPHNAKRAYKDAESRNLDYPNLHLDRYSTAFLEGDDTTMREELDWAMGKAGVEDMFLSAQADTEAYYGRAAKARALSNRAVQSAKLAGIRETAAERQAMQALREVELGNKEAARQAAEKALTLAPGRDVSAMAALALARVGDSIRAGQVADKLDEMFPQDTMVQNYSLPTIRAAVELSKSKPSQAVELLVVTIPYEFGIQSFGYLYPAYLRGEAYLKANQPQQAAAEFQKILDHPGIPLNFVIGALSRLQLARARAKMDDRVAARKSYEAFFSSWSGADADVPILVAAKTEYRTLQ